MKKFRIASLALILLLFVSLLPVSALAVYQPEIGAEAAMLVDAATGEVYFEKNADRTVQPASTTKLVTALLVAEAIDRGDISLSDMVTAYDDCQYNMDEESSNAGPVIEPGEELSVEQLLYCAMLASANEACNILAEYVSGSVSAFVEAMNARASELGCTGTHFTNTNGLEDAGHYTTASDFALLTREALRHPLVLQICDTLNYSVPATNRNDARALMNTNSLLNPDSEYYFEYAYGLKTGFFTAAGYCLVSAAEKDDMDVVCVLFGGRELGDQFADSLTLYHWLFENFTNQQVLSTTATIATIPVELGTSDSTGVRAESTVSAILPNDYDTTRIGYQYRLYHEAEGQTALTAPVNAGQVLGEITVVELDDSNQVVRTFGSSALVATASVDMSRMEYLRSQIKDLFQKPVVRRVITILIIALAVYILLIFFYYIQRIRHLRSLREAKRERARRLIEQEADWLDIPGDEPREPSIDYFGSDEPEPPPAEEKRFDSLGDDYFDSFFKS